MTEAQPYRFRWITPTGAQVEGPVVAFTPLPMTDSDRATAREAAAGGRTSVSIGGQNRSFAPPRVDPLFADAKPAFPVHVPLIDRAGRVWVQRTVAAGAPNQYDVFDRRGVVVDRVVVPEAVRLVGFGVTSAYAVRTDADDLLYLQRYPLR